MQLNFVDRHNGPRRDEENEMLKTLGCDTLEQLVNRTVPENIRLKAPLDIPEAVSESEYLSSLKKTASLNKNFRSLIGTGFYGTYSPAVITRNIFENPVWYTSYTPYQAEISQGRLEALLNFQTMISSLTGFSLSNCSMLDDATAAAEAMRMMFNLRSRESVKEGRDVLFVDSNVFPAVLSVIKTRSRGLGIKVVTGDFSSYGFDGKCFGAIVQYPAADGQVRDYGNFCKKAHDNGAMVAAYCDILSLAILKEPAAWGADIAFGSAQRFGLPMGFGGPTAGFLACSDQYRRTIPGRIIGVSVDRLGKKAYRLALQTREQHIKREKATSNICTATALMATMTGMFAVWYGPEGIRSIAKNAFDCAHLAAESLKKAGYSLVGDKFFDTITISGADTGMVRKKAEEAGFNFCYPGENLIRISFDELSSREEVSAVCGIFGCTATGREEYAVDGQMARTTPILKETVFNRYHCETEMMRYIKALERRDISLAHSMIPLGSCTMKLNAAVEMLPLSWSEFGNLHPYAPADQCKGTMQIIREVERDLAVITGFAGCSLQPNSGAAGEYAGLTTIRNYLLANGGEKRNVMIIPTSAHGTNPASAAMAGFDIELVSCDDKGNINVEELAEKAGAAGERLAGMMITYPSTHGVFEVRIREIADIIHRNGGLLYMDGANMNAQVGLTNPGTIGADVCHLNLHKTFAMPHGGGGPGVGPICATEALVPYLPGHPEIPECGGKGITAVSAAPFGSPLLLPITHAYIRLLGAEGLKKASEIAILNANYVSARLMPELKTLYTGATGYVAHECIIDLQHFRAQYGVDATDVAKRLMDFGFHAPTLSFPVHETLMIEPTESEPKAELDRFVEAVKTIVGECEKIKSGELDAADNPLKMSPHTAEEVCSDNWSHPYSRTQAAYPLEWLKENKFWPACSRVDNGFGDRNLVTTNE